MDDRKRPASYDQDEAAPPTKRQATSTVNGPAKSHQDSDLPGKDDLERFQKEAIYRQMQEYKREKTSLEGQLIDLKKRSTHHDDHLRTIDAWFGQLLDEIKLLAGNIQDGSLFSTFPSSLLSADNSGFEKHLKSRSSAIESAIKDIFSKAEHGRPEVSELQERISQLLKAEKEHINELEKARIEKEQLQERLETASMRYMVAEKKLDRAKSTTVAKLERQATAGGKSETGSGLGGGVDNKSEAVNGQVDSQALAQAEVARREADAACAKQAEQLEQLSNENQKLISQLTNLKSKSPNQQSDEDYAHTELFKHARKQLEDFVNRINNLEATNAELRREAKRLQSERAAYRTEVDAEIHATNSEKDLLLSKAEGDLVRIRATRDELQAELQMKRQAKDQDRVAAEQIKQMVAAKEERIQSLESEIERLSSTQGETSDVVNDLPLEELQTRYTNLDKKYSMLNQELASMSNAYKKMSLASSQKLNNLTEMEDKVTKFAAEKAKADQKYFAAMKAKEARDQETRTLRIQNSKSAEIVSQLKEVEASTRQLVVALEKQVAESREAFSILETKHHAVQTQVVEKTSSVENTRKQLDEIKTLVAGKDSEQATTSSALRKAEVDIEKLKANLAEKDTRIATFSPANAETHDEKINASLRALVYCNICQTNPKDHALRCGHTFCKVCIDDRIANRMRKCPNCGKGFGTSDLLKILL
ncbi:E3 ubiquitin-protein ligase bre1 [Thelotrema lepadinum]|nr:E3 ubiquitin-protein ligase bre1 [Thelotrema lepadinum]